jgi:glutathione S-transferase
MPGYAHLLTDDTDPEIPYLCSFEGCPFAQTVRMTLVHKGVRFRHSEVRVMNEDVTGMADKPDWFLALSPKGRVPVLLHRGRVLYESAMIDQYLDEVFSQRPLMPADPCERLIARIWLHQASTTLPRLWYRTLNARPEDVASCSARLLEFLGDWEDALGEHGGDGPWLFGERWALPDLFMAPFYERFEPALGHFDKFHIPDDGSLPRVRRHHRESLQHPAFSATRLDPSWLTNLYRPFARREEWISAERNRAVRDIVE